MKPYYQDDYCTIYHADNRDFDYPDAGMVLTDPPYGIGASGGCRVNTGWATCRRYDDYWDNVPPSECTLKEILLSAPLSIIWGGNYMAHVLPRGTHWIVWDKMQTMPTFSDCELAWTNSPRKSVTKVTVEWNGLLGKEKTRHHPTQKPLSLMLWCLDTYHRDGLVLDPFMGSGTTLRAAKDLGKESVGIEIEEKYCEIAAKRLEQEVLPLSPQTG